MKFRKLGNTGLLASEVSLGTAEIGFDYGFKGSPHYSRPSLQDSSEIRHSCEPRLSVLLFLPQVLSLKSEM